MREQNINVLLFQSQIGIISDELQCKRQRKVVEQNPQ